jgi:hypothetical protein
MLVPDQFDRYLQLKGKMLPCKRIAGDMERRVAVRRVAGSHGKENTFGQSHAASAALNRQHLAVLPIDQGKYDAPPGGFACRCHAGHSTLPGCDYPVTPFWRRVPCDAFAHVTVTSRF